MVEVVLDDEQSRIVSGAEGPVAVRDRNGALVGILSTRTNTANSERLSEDDYIAEVKRRLATNRPRHSTGEVLAHLKSLDAS